MARCYRTCCTAKRRGCGAIQRIAGKARCCGNRLRALGFTPRRYRHRYFDGWQEKDIRAAMLFGRAFEEALAALLRHEDPAVVLFDKWAVCKNMGLTYSGYDTWDRMLQQGIQLLERFARDGRVRVRRPQSNQQIQLTRTLSSGNNF